MKVLFIIPAFHNGGTTTCLKNIVSSVHRDSFNIEVFAITDAGPARDYISQYATIVSANGHPSTPRNQRRIGADVPIKQKIVRVISVTAKWFKKVLNRVGIDVSALLLKRVANNLEKNAYDVVVAFQERQATLLGSFFKQEAKIAWVHCDYKRIARNRDARIYAKYKQIVCVSDFTKRQFLDVRPDCVGKVIALHNFVNEEMVLEKAGERPSIPMDTSLFTIVSVGRLDEVKRFDRIPEISARMKMLGFAFRWYIIGGGGMRVEQKIEVNIHKFDVGDCVIMLGESNNPYPYIAQANMLVSTSSSEACPCVFYEAMILRTPIMSADFGSAVEFIQECSNGWISSIECMADKIIKVVRETNEYEKVREHLRCYQSERERLVEELTNIITRIAVKKY